MDSDLTSFQKKKRAELLKALEGSKTEANVTVPIPSPPPVKESDDLKQSEIEEYKKVEANDELSEDDNKSGLLSKFTKKSEGVNKDQPETAKEVSPVINSEVKQEIPEEAMPTRIEKQDHLETPSNGTELKKEDYEIASKKQVDSVTEPTINKATSEAEVTTMQPANVEAQTEPQIASQSMGSDGKETLTAQPTVSDNTKDIEDEDKIESSNKEAKDSQAVSVNINLNLSPETLKSGKDLAGKSYGKVVAIFEKLITTTFKPVDEFDEYEHFVDGKIDPKYSAKLARQMLSVSVLFVFTLVVFAIINNILGTVISVTFLREICFIILMIALSLVIYKYQKYLYLDHPYPIVVMTGGVLLGIIALLLLVNHFYLSFLVTAGASAFLFYYGVTRIDKDLTKLSKQFSKPTPERTCPNCGNKIKKGENYCYTCEEYVY
ncbi:zinc ribbon domain-containing protein [Candidatus Dojkabacteria bacterium]|uniref:Zinc ribbon domain-containing protein n=1 Tax=Candidatus Dojkabacteria bacterium TaxID=2099670 RepID=A0A955L3R4_9BACT|nr:zinc ribbon domain-containing protein [Candidatus Dojkabacteria bacterium]